MSKKTFKGILKELGESIIKMADEMEDNPELKKGGSKKKVKNHFNF